jgi:glycosyltransferase involved in cell wall biosynthesis
MEGPLVSVIVPVYNGDRFLAAALESILSQDYHPFEVIVVDDGSTDGTAGIARSFGGVRYIHQSNHGLAAARNAGMAAALGEFIAFLDADDVMLPKKLSVEVGYLLDHPEVGCVLSRQQTCLEAGTSPPAWLRRDPIFGDMGGVVSGSMTVRRSALRRAGVFDPSYRIAVGMEFFGRLRDAGIGVAILPEVLLVRRIHDANLTHLNRALRDELLRGLKRKIDRRRTSAPPKAQDQ